MAAVQWNRIGKYIKDFSLHFRRNRRKRTEDEDEEQEDKEYSGDARDESPGDIQMGNGTHKPVYGIRRKIIGGFSGGCRFCKGRLPDGDYGCGCNRSFDPQNVRC